MFKFNIFLSIRLEEIESESNEFYEFEANRKVDALNESIFDLKTQLEKN